MPLVNSRSASSRGFKCELDFTKITFHVVNALLNGTIYISMLLLITVNLAGPPGLKRHTLELFPLQCH
jgi:hypothetical protein